MTTDSDSGCSYVANMADFNVIIVIVIKIIVIIVIIIVIVIKFEKRFTEIESQIHIMYNVK